MAKKKASSLLKTAKVFINENDDAIEKDVYLNADNIEKEIASKPSYLKKAHEAIVEVLALESTDDSRYFDYYIFEKMVNEKLALRKERRDKAEAKRAVSQIKSNELF